MVQIFQQRRRFWRNNSRLSTKWLTLWVEQIGPVWLYCNAMSRNPKFATPKSDYWFQKSRSRSSYKLSTWLTKLMSFYFYSTRWNMYTMNLLVIKALVLPCEGKCNCFPYPFLKFFYSNSDALEPLRSWKPFFQKEIKIGKILFWSNNSKSFSRNTNTN